MSAPIEVFSSYAHVDEPYLKQLHIHLSLLKRQRLISVWHDRKILPGTNWAQAIDAHLEQASLILLLISPDFFASDYCYEIEMQRALQRHEAGQARVIPIVVRPCDWQRAPIAALQSLPVDGKPVTIWDNQDVAWNNVASGIRRVIEDLPLLTASAQRSALPPIWNIPYPRNPFFMGREELLSRLHTQLQAGQTTALSQPQAVSGLGGIGKTQIAVEYAYRYHQEYEVVLWAPAANQEVLISSCSTIATLLKLPEREASEQEILVQAVKEWLQTHGKWLLILDNADDLDLLPPYLPPAHAGHMLITTRAWDMQRLAQRVEVETLPHEQAALFLLQRAALIAPDATLSQVSAQDRALAAQITQELGGLPLALDQAGAYLEATGVSLSQYQQVYQQHQQELLHERRARVPDHPEAVATTWSLSFAQVEQKSPAAADLLRLCAFLNPDAIPLEIILEGTTNLGPRLALIAKDTYLLGQAIEVLRAYSLVDRHRTARMLSLHRLVQVVLRGDMSEQERLQWTYRVIAMLADVFPKNEYAKWSTCEQLVPHVLDCEERTHLWENVPLELASLLEKAGSYLSSRAQYGQAGLLYQRALHIRRQTLGSEHPDVVSSLAALARLHYQQGEFSQSEELYQQALSIQHALGLLNHPNTAFLYDRLAYVAAAQNRDEQAEALYQRALCILEQQSSDQSNIVRVLINLGALFSWRGEDEQAELLYQRALRIWEQHPGFCLTGTILLTNLAKTCLRQGKYEQAEQWGQQALDICKQMTDANHPHVAIPLECLAAIYRRQGKYELAEQLGLRALCICEHALGPEHPDLLRVLNELIQIYKGQGKHEQMEQLYQRTLLMREQIFAPIGCVTRLPI